MGEAERVRVVRGQWGVRWDSDVYASRGLFLGPVTLFSTHPVAGWGHRKPRIYSIRVGRWQLKLEQRKVP